MCFKVFPSGNHSRYVHSIGTYHLSRRVLQHLHHSLNKREALLIQLAALLHDIGHGPFSHVFERTIQKSICSTWTHEKQTIRIVHYMVHKYNIPLSQKEIEQVCAYIDPPTTCIKNWKYQIVANKYNSIDVDKMDYLQRDMFVMGLYSKVPVDRIIAGMIIKNDEICFRTNIASDIADLLFQRFRMYRQIYQHRVVVACDVLVEEVLNGIQNLKSYIDNIEMFVHLNDQTIMFITNNTSAQHMLDRRTFDRSLGKNHNVMANIAGHDILHNILKNIHLTNNTSLSDSKVPQVQMLTLLSDEEWL
jgi:HD superfamily phosphohydrolase